MNFNFSQIKFGITKVFRTFEVPNTLQVAERYQNIGGIFYVIILDTVEKRCRNYRDGLNTIVPPVGIRQRKVRHRFLLCIMPKIHSIKMKIFQTVSLGGQELNINGTFSLPNALTAYSFFRQFSGMRVVAEIEGDVNLQLDILLANNPNSIGVITMLRHLYYQIEPTLSKMENVENPMYLLNDN